MHVSENGINFLKQKEGILLTPYRDAGGKMTIGVGHLVRPGEYFPSLITIDRAEQLLKEDLSVVEAVVNEYVEHRLDQNQFDALCSLCFNIGTSAFIKSTLVKLLNENSILKAAQEFLKWDHIDGQVSYGLLARRKAEAALFLA